MLQPLQSALVEGTAWLDPFVQDFRARFMTLLAGAFRGFAPGLALSLLHPQLNFSEAETQHSLAQPLNVRKADGSLVTAYDLKRLQVCCCNAGTQQLPWFAGAPDLFDCRGAAECCTAPACQPGWSCLCCLHDLKGVQRQTDSKPLSVYWYNARTVHSVTVPLACMSASTTPCHPHVLTTHSQH